MSDVFISYPRRSEKYAASMSDALQNRNISTWLYTRDLRPGEAWFDEILKAMENARIIAFIIEPTSVPSTGQQKEYMAALEYSWSDMRKTLLPILIGNTTPPPFLRDREALRIRHQKSDWARAANIIERILRETTTVKVTEASKKERTQRLNAIEKGAGALREIDGQRLLAEAMRYLAQSDPVSSRAAIELLSELVRTEFRITERGANRVRTVSRNKTASKQFQ